MEHSICLRHGEVHLRPLTMDDAPALFSIIDEESWRGLATPMPENVADLRGQLAYVLDASDSIAFAVEIAGAVVGRTGFHSIVPGLRLELGTTYFSPVARGTMVNATSKYLLLSHAFESMQVMRVGMRCDSRNLRSSAAMAKIGARFEGRLRNFRRGPAGEMVDVDYYGITADEWPMVRSRLQQRIGDDLVPLI